MAESTTTARAAGVFTRDQVEILAARKGEPDWLRDARLEAWRRFAATPMPDTRPEEWRYTEIARILDLDVLAFADESAPVASPAGLPAGAREAIERGDASARLVQSGASVVLRDVPDELAARGVVVTSLEAAAREHPELVRRHLGTAATADEGKFAAMSGAFWTGGLFVHVPEGVKVEAPVRLLRRVTAAGRAAFGRVLVVAGRGAEFTVLDEMSSERMDERTLSLGAVEVFAEEGARVHYVSLQRWGRGVVHLSTDRFVAGRDARVTALYAGVGADVTRIDARCRLAAPGAHVDLLGVYIADDDQHFDHQTLQDHAAPHASSNLLFKGALNDRGRSVFRGLIRVHPGAQRTDAYQTNRNLILSSEARADSLPNLEIAADDVRCSHAATVGQLDEEELFYLLSRGVPKREAMRLVVFGFFAEVLEQVELEGVRDELLAVVERKLAAHEV